MKPFYDSSKAFYDSSNGLQVGRLGDDNTIAKSDSQRMEHPEEAYEKYSMDGKISECVNEHLNLPNYIGK